MGSRAGFIVSLVLLGCGGKSGLEAFERDPSGDPPRDAGVEDARSDAPSDPLDATLPPDGPEDGSAPPSNGRVRVAVLDQAPEPCRFRMQRVLEHIAEPIAVIPLESELDVLRGYDLVILCAGWAFDPETRERILARRNVTRSYIEEGGGFLIFQPNDLEAVHINVAQHWFRLEAGFSYDDDPEVHFSNHAVTSGFSDRDMPYRRTRSSTSIPAGESWRAVRERKALRFSSASTAFGNASDASHSISTTRASPAARSSGRITPTPCSTV